jgi:hypothetical protein
MRMKTAAQGFVRKSLPRILHFDGAQYKHFDGAQYKHFDGAQYKRLALRQAQDKLSIGGTNFTKLIYFSFPLVKISGREFYMSVLMDEKSAYGQSRFCY